MFYRWFLLVYAQYFTSGENFETIKQEYLDSLHTEVRQANRELYNTDRMDITLGEPRSNRNNAALTPWRTTLSCECVRDFGFIVGVLQSTCGSCDGKYRRT